MTPASISHFLSSLTMTTNRNYDNRNEQCLSIANCLYLKIFHFYPHSKKRKQRQTSHSFCYCCDERNLSPVQSKKKMGMTRLELLAAGGFEDNGSFTEILNDLEWCGFIRSYTMMGYRTKSDIFQLIDHYTPVSYTHLTLPTRACRCRSRWSPYH